MVSILRVAAAVNKATAGDPNACLREIQHTIALLGDSPADLVIFPQLALAPPDNGSLLSSSWLAEGARYVWGKPPLYRRRWVMAALAAVLAAGLVFMVLRNLPGWEFLGPVR